MQMINSKEFEFNKVLITTKHDGLTVMKDDLGKL